jgi:Fur family ferric uptake transcriptional regulator
VLSQRGMIQQLDLGGTPRRFDGNTTNHYHVRCLRCGRVEDVAVEPVAGIEEAVRQASDYEVVGHRLEFIGLCPRCRAELPSTGKCADEAGGNAG